MGGDSQHRNMVAVTVEKAVNQVQVARPAGTGAYRQFAGKLGLRSGGEGGHFFVARGHPIDGPHAVQAVA